MSSLAYGQGNVAPINVNTDHAAYGTGEIITIFGFVKDYDGSNDVVIQVFAPNGNLASVAQISPDSDGNYSTELTAAGMISLEGEYIVKVQIINSGPQRNQTVFEFVGGEAAPTAPAAPEESVTTTEPEPVMEPEPVTQATEPICGKGTVLKDGLCVVEQEK